MYDVTVWLPAPLTGVDVCHNFPDPCAQCALLTRLHVIPGVNTHMAIGHYTLTLFAVCRGRTLGFSLKHHAPIHSRCMSEFYWTNVHPGVDYCTTSLQDRLAPPLTRVDVEVSCTSNNSPHWPFSVFSVFLYFVWEPKHRIE